MTPLLFAPAVTASPAPASAGRGRRRLSSCKGRTPRSKTTLTEGPLTRPLAWQLHRLSNGCSGVGPTARCTFSNLESAKSWGARGGVARWPPARPATSLPLRVMVSTAAAVSASPAISVIEISLTLPARFLEGFEAVQALRRGDVALRCLVPGYRPQLATRADHARAVVRVAMVTLAAGLNKAA
jgi:hypothetical protein